MTRLLLNIRNLQDVVIGIENGFDILDITVDDRQGLQGLERIFHALGGKAQLSLTIGIPFFDFHTNYLALPRIDFLRVKTEKIEKELDWSKLKQFARKQKTILLIDTDKTTPADWYLLLQQAANARLYGVMLENYCRNSERLTRQYMVAEIGKFVEEARRLELAAGLGGTLEPPDIPRILPYHADIIGFSVMRMARLDKDDLKKNMQLVRLLIPVDREMAIDKVEVDMGTDRILVSDFKLFLHIGAYDYEHKKKQRVCFNVAVDVARISINPENMSHIFSYDLILDGIRSLVVFGHIDLIETLAEQIAAFILSYPRVRRVMVRVEKLDLEPRAVGIEIVRTKTTGHSYL
ncbi:MAG: Dihydroneopterin aldolase [Candidatus Tokpelaia sp. JSC189]|nr:MAG: Dihydroneopterin aldolase [Candidatus Tokpelaia sp. JSC189]